MANLTSLAGLIYVDGAVYSSEISETELPRMLSPAEWERESARAVAPAP